VVVVGHVCHRDPRLHRGRTDAWCSINLIPRRGGEQRGSRPGEVADEVGVEGRFAPGGVPGWWNRRRSRIALIRMPPQSRSTQTSSRRTFETSFRRRT